MTNEPPRDHDDPTPAHEDAPELSSEERGEYAYAADEPAAPETAASAEPPVLPPPDASDEPGAPAAAPPAAAPADTAPARKRLTRSRHDSVIGGVAGGFAEYVDADPTLVRLAFVVLALITGGAMVLVYIGAWIVMPEGDDLPRGARAARGERRSGIGAGLFWGIVLILLGALLLLRQLDVELPSWDAFLAGALIVVGLLILIESRRGLNGGLTVLAVILTILLGITTLMNVTVQGAFGDQNVRVQQLADLDSSYGHAFGSMTLDLRDVEFPEGTTNISASIIFGNMTVRLPDNVGVRASATSVFGSTQIGNEDRAGFSIDWEYQSPNYGTATQRVHLDMSTVFGSAQVTGGR